MRGCGLRVTATAVDEQSGRNDPFDESTRGHAVWIPERKGCQYPDRPRRLVENVRLRDGRDREVGSREKHHQIIAPLTMKCLTNRTTVKGNPHHHNSCFSFILACPCRVAISCKRK